MSEWWWMHRGVYPDNQGPLVPDEDHPDPATTVLVYRTRHAWRFVVLQTVRVADGIVVRIPHHWNLRLNEIVVVKDALRRVAFRAFLYPFPETASPVEVITPTVASLIRIFLNEDVHVTDRRLVEGVPVADDVVPDIADRVERTLAESVHVADDVTPDIADRIEKTLAESVHVADGIDGVEAGRVEKTLPESVAVADGIDRAEADRTETSFPETASPVDVLTTTMRPLTVVRLDEQVKVTEGGVENPPPEDPEAEYTWWRYRLGEKILIADQITYEVIGALPLYEDIKVYPWAGTAVLDEDPAFSYTTEVSEEGTDYVEVGYFDFNEEEADIKGVFMNLVWAQKITGSGSGKVKWQAASGSNASPGDYADITDEEEQTGTGYGDHGRSGVVHKITGFPSQMPFTIRCLVKNVDATSAEAKIKSNSYVRAAYKRVS